MASVWMRWLLLEPGAFINSLNAFVSRAVVNKFPTQYPKSEDPPRLLTRF
ncbi:MAG: hypothetical protein P8Y97_22685 [Candidatus Lokiarchaeota archaeon]